TARDVPHPPPGGLRRAAFSALNMKLLAAVLMSLVLVGSAPALAPAPGPSWAHNLLTGHDDRFPGRKLGIWYLQAVRRPGAHHRDGSKPRIDHHTELLATRSDGSELRFRTRVEPAVDVRHEVRLEPDGLNLTFTLSNPGAEASPVQWFQPACIRVGAFTD